MLIESSKYQPNSLRNGREEAFKKDLADSYFLFQNQNYDVFSLTVNQFRLFWEVHSELSLLIHLRNVQEDEEQYFQVLSKTVILEYFVNKPTQMKIFCLFCLYFIQASVDSNGERNQRPIYVTEKFTNELSDFVQAYSSLREKDFICIIPYISKHFIYTIKFGLQTPLITVFKNGQIVQKNSNQDQKKKMSDEYQKNDIKKIIPFLDSQAQKYAKLKNNFIKMYKLPESQKKCLKGFDQNIGKRMQQDLRRYEQLFKPFTFLHLTQD